MSRLVWIVLLASAALGIGFVLISDAAPNPVNKEGVSGTCDCCNCNTDTYNLTPGPSSTPTATVTITVTPGGSPVPEATICVSSSCQASSQSGSGVAWAIPQSILASKNFYNGVLDYDSVSYTTSQILHNDNCGFNLPVDSTLLGFLVPYGVLSALPNGVVAPFDPNATVCNTWLSEPVDNLIKLINGSGAIVGNNNATGRNITDPTGGGFYGGVSDLWGAGLTVADVNSASFGVAIQVGAWQDGPSTQATPCAVYHVFSSNDPAYNPHINGAAQVEVCYEPLGPTPTPAPPTATGTITQTPTVTPTENVIQETTFLAASSSQIDSGGTLAWTLTDANDAQRTWIAQTATTKLFQGKTMTRNGGNALLSGSTVLGIKVTLTWSKTNMSASSDLVVQLLGSSDTLVGSNRGNATTIPNGAVVYGSSVDTWGAGFVGADINGEWGLGIQVSGTATPVGSINFTISEVKVYWQ